MLVGVKYTDVSLVSKVHLWARQPPLLRAALSSRCQRRVASVASPGYTWVGRTGRYLTTPRCFTPPADHTLFTRQRHQRQSRLVLRCSSRWSTECGSGVVEWSLLPWSLEGEQWEFTWPAPEPANQTVSSPALFPFLSPSHVSLRFPTHCCSCPYHPHAPSPPRTYLTPIPPSITYK
ncbi:hypothetical protein E2C01_009825 [Portunus trituberculatus]|uniref:Uncharacterized protein n=1 Tax=Portunus trituberculatus TaxID=210409 RepID=A0A5B7D6R5_PORTR|nr:hypothetical protein [Portunus trituberculatus]